jgi:hypothetical protein
MILEVNILDNGKGDNLIFSLFLFKIGGKDFCAWT